MSTTHHVTVFQLLFHKIHDNSNKLILPSDLQSPQCMKVQSVMFVWHELSNNTFFSENCMVHDYSCKMSETAWTLACVQLLYSSYSCWEGPSESKSSFSLYFP